jgi:hypothetical protein
LNDHHNGRLPPRFLGIEREQPIDLLAGSVAGCDLLQCSNSPACASTILLDAVETWQRWCAARDGGVQTLG